VEIVQGSLTMTGLNSDAPKVFWNGHPVLGILEIKTEWEQDEHRVKLKVNGTDDSLYMELVAGGIIVKKVVGHE
jgi:hypothetical protein